MIRKLSRGIALLLTAALLAGCQLPALSNAPETTLPPETTVPVETVGYTTPADSNQDDVTFLGTYTDRSDAGTVVATVEDKALTNGVLQALYWLEVSTYCSSGAQLQPDLSLPLDVQECPVDDSVNSWQQYFLDRALATWHSAQALAVQSQVEGLPLEEAYQPDLELHEKFLKDIPATRFLYGYNPGYQPNTLHQAYLDQIPQLLETLAGEKGYADAETMALEAAGTSLDYLTAAVTLYNFGYAYMTTLSHELTCSEEELQTLAGEDPRFADETPLVTLRHILLVPQGEDVVIAEDGTVTCSQEAWDACRREAENLLRAWETGAQVTEAAFGDLAYRHSADKNTALLGGLYRNVRRGQLISALDSWGFYTTREPGDTSVLRSDYGYHVVYFSGRITAGEQALRNEVLSAKQKQLMADAREKYPITVDYSAIGLTDGQVGITYADVLYPDVAHERIPEIPLYLQQDYPKTMYGAYPVATHGCGITTMSMMASYLTDDELTVPEMCARFGRYCVADGTSYLLFSDEPANLGFYMREYTHLEAVAKAALEEGCLVVTTQGRGYWTRGGHFIVIEELLEGDKIRVRDSNLHNYGTLPGHFEDQHDWSTVPYTTYRYWIYEKKVTTDPNCLRCGNPEELEGGRIVADYCCEKCRVAMLRRENYLTGTAE